MKLNKRNMFSLVLAGALAAGFAFPAYAQTDAASDQEAVVAATPDELTGGDVAAFAHGAGDKQECCVESLGLTDEQIEKLISLRDQYGVSTAAKKAELKSEMHQMLNLMSAANVDKKAASDLHKKMAALRDDISDARFNFFLSSADVFTAEQRKTMHHEMLLHMLKGGWGKGGRHHHHRMHGHGG